MKLTDDEKDDLEAMEDDELRVSIEEAVRKRKKIKDDKTAYTKACSDLIKLQEARMDHAVDVLEKRAIEAGGRVAPSPSPPPPPSVSVAPPPPPPPPIAH